MLLFVRGFINITVWNSVFFLISQLSYYIVYVILPLFDTASYRTGYLHGNFRYPTRKHSFKVLEESHRRSR